MGKQSHLVVDLYENKKTLQNFHITCRSISVVVAREDGKMRVSVVWDEGAVAFLLSAVKPKQSKTFSTPFTSSLSSSKSVRAKKEQKKNKRKPPMQ